MASSDIRSRRLASSDSFCSRSGGGDLYRWLCRRHRNDLQVCEWQRRRGRFRWLRLSAPAESSITGIQSISQEPGSNQISIKYNTVSTQEAQGSLNDQRIQQLLLFAARNNYNSGVRMDSVDLLTQQPNNTHVREALIYALRYDSNPGVRLKALDGLGAYVKSDPRVRDACLRP